MSEISPVVAREHYAPARGPAAPVSAAALLFLRGRDADGRIRGLVAERRLLRPVLGTLALRLVRRRCYEPLGFRSLGNYARECLGVTACVVREWARVWEALASLPLVRAAVISGDVSWSVARRAVAHASPETDAAFAEALRGRTVRAAEEMLRVAFGAGAKEPGETDRAERVRVSVPLPAVELGRWLAALELARRSAGEALPVWECAEAIAAEALGAIAPRLVAQAVANMSRADSPAPGAAQRSATLSRPSREHGLRREAFWLLRWERSGVVSEARLARLAAFAESASPHGLDRALRGAMRRLQRIDHDLGHLLRQVCDRKLHRELGFPTFDRYAEERVDVSPRTARRWVRMARLGPVGSEVANAFRSSEITPKQADVIAEVVPPKHQVEAVAFARSVTLRRLEDEHGVDSLARGAVTFSSPPEAASVFLVALEAARLQLEAGKQASQSATDALLWVLDHVIAAWAEQGAQFRDYADFNRDQFRCTAPGCTARRSLQSHHVVHRSAGGPDEAWNRTTLCAFHHLRGVHAHTISCRGRAPDGLVFEMGLRAEGPPLARIASGDVLLAGLGASLARGAR